MEIVKLSHRNLNAWLDFFDNRAFSDNKEWKGCYCTYYFYPRLERSDTIGKSRREYAKWLIENNKMNGYLVYEDGRVIGWCNVGAKRNYPKLKGSDRAHNGTKSIVCFMIEEQYRGKGIAKALLKRIVKDSKKDGTRKIEAYPNVNAKNQFSHYHGPIKMYLDQKFEIDKTWNSSKVKLVINKT